MLVITLCYNQTLTCFTVLVEDAILHPVNALLPTFYVTKKWLYLYEHKYDYVHALIALAAWS